MITTNTTVHLIKHLDVTDLSGEKVMVDFSTGKYFLLKGSANDIWDMLSEQITVGEIQTKLMNIYDVDAETCLSAIIEFLQQMLQNEFISLENA